MPAPTPYQYPSAAGQAAGLRAHEECEIEHPRHLVRPAKWPPRAKSAADVNPTMGLLCERCGCHCLAEAGHATGEIAGIEVVLPEPLPMPAGRA